VLITNVKPGKLRDVMSAGLVGLDFLHCSNVEQLTYFGSYLCSFEVDKLSVLGAPLLISLCMFNILPRYKVLHISGRLPDF